MHWTELLCLHTLHSQACPAARGPGALSAHSSLKIWIDSSTCLGILSRDSTSLLSRAIVGAGTGGKGGKCWSCIGIVVKLGLVHNVSCEAFLAVKNLRRVSISLVKAQQGSFK